MIANKSYFWHSSKITMKFFKNIRTVLLVFVVCMITPTSLLAQVDPCTDPFEYCPIDDNVILLIVAVILLAAYKAITLYKQNLAK
jgi:hypothetical protein